MEGEFGKTKGVGIFRGDLGGLIWKIEGSIDTLTEGGKREKGHFAGVQGVNEGFELGKQQRGFV